VAADPTVLEGLDPYDLMDQEAARLDAFFSELPDDAWQQPSACKGWTVKDLLGHLAASEAYNRACMTDTIPALMEELGARGVTDMDSFNAVGVADRADRPRGEVLEEWRAECGETRRWLRAHGGGEMSTMVGPYPVDWQAFHLANELAIHADDAGVPVEDATAREAWLAQVAQFVVSETAKPVSIKPTGGGYAVSSEGVEANLSPATLVAAVNGRLPAGAIDDQLAGALNFMG
jgi:uncharacterized protein (TIGR03083 family)